MATIDIADFRGIAPLIDPRKLAGGAAVLARDCVLQGHDLRPLRESVVETSLGFTPSQMHKYQFDGQSYWLAWSTPYVVDVVPSPIAQDELGRLYWTRYNPGAADPGDDNYPRCATQPTQSAITNNTTVIRRLGIPAPTDAPTLVETQVDTTIPPVTMSQTSPVTVTTATDHAFKDGQRVVVTFDTVPDEPLNMSELSGKEFVIGNAEARQFDLRGSDGANYTEFTDPTGVTIERVYGDSDLETRSYVYTFVSDWGEEGVPSPPTEPSDIRYDSAIDVTCATTISAPFNTYVNRIRVYRSAAGTTGANFFYVGEASIPSPGSPVVFHDDVQPISLGELLPSTDWAMPPNRLQGLVQMPNGFLAGFVDNTVYFSEAYLPHAWPDKYRKTVDRDIVGMAVYGQTLVVATKGQPVLMTGTDPQSVSDAKLDLYAPCIARRSVCSTGSGVAFATYDGMAFVSGSGGTIITEPYIKKAQWAEYFDASMQAIWHDSRYIALSTTSGKTLIIHFDQSEGLRITTSTVTGTAPATDPDDDSMHHGLGTSRARFDYGDAIEANWHSGVFTMPRALSLSAGQVFASEYPVTLTIGYADLASPQGQTGGVITDSFNVTVAGPESFRLPAGFLSREWDILVKTEHNVQRIILAESTDELR